MPNGANMWQTQNLNPYVYTNNNPITNTDPFGLAVATVGCSSTAIAKIQSAAAKADAASQTCLPCENRKSFRDKIRSLTVKCSTWNINPATGNSVCGVATGAGTGISEITLTPQGIAGGGCGCLQELYFMRLVI